MTTQDLFTAKSNCCGCELCSVVCPRNIIKMHPDREGFLYPKIDDDSKCVNCRRCISVCPEKAPGHIPYRVIDSYGGYSLDTDSVKRSSSGGFATAISQEFIRHGGIVYGVRYSDDFTCVEYSRADNIESVESFRTSKYSQAKKGTVYQDVLTDIKNAQRVLFIGLPCEISALYHYIGRYTANLYTISLICHGPTSPSVQRDFVRGIIEKYHSPIKSFSLRNKLNGWKPYYIYSKTYNGRIFKKKFNESSYGAAFLLMKRPSCSSCRYKYGDMQFGLQSDITLGDFHSVNKQMPHYNLWGVSQLCVQSEKGKYLLGLISDSCKVEVIANEKVEKGNIAFQKPIPMSPYRQKFVDSYLNHSLDYASHLLVVLIPRYRSFLKKTIMRVLSRVKHMI